MYQVGDVVEGVITGIQPYGAFVRIDDNHNGLLHISEVSDDYIHDIRQYLQMEETLQVKILDLGEDDHHFKLSLKALRKEGGRYRRSNVQKLLPEHKLGFRTLEEKLPIWIKETLQEENDD
ncbi:MULTISPECIES: CvfD/Ygs/GSP13 family RNA-binding post-transcriptional regulator [unclassified Breznakia]|uniref:CvfD/Ygs/GSP13 family RNA-binding post-transcriptional regulator n=1 Tax=unclassified Breznakia TaxID=2623764 RepID=UPI002473A20B|nr:MULTISPECIES: CvfD/Ygs/GSP13 family RNA-binding post-transcriptional regulator [unclassified Breznakia]MDH6366434.1 general stress protein 13 [Breznakia sp. PH1-1]MDH6403527.1 general stress protein 13 [Breznakia sp. PF1-11]MDH6411236.1 general stress protein 13 [Breznakia sp. PFB1-11]MDH6413501.1 general stress protein 13 [Breznakia sp. PFB1-14]MDH6415781.1 general stress protein 13 [Breznakia sp. PFB1-4]